VYVNPDQIEWIVPFEGGCCVWTKGNTWIVAEAPELVAQLASDLKVRSSEDLR
jgi:hypothetical protein